MQQILYRSLKDHKIHTAKKSRRGCWIRIEDPNDIELENLIDKYQLDEAIVLDALDPYEVPRIEKEEETVYCIIRLPANNQITVVTIPLLIIVTSQNVITVSKNIWLIMPKPKNHLLTRLFFGKNILFTGQFLEFLSRHCHNCRLIFLLRIKIL